MPVAASVGLGAIIGAGIFVLSGTAIALAGPEALIAFLIVGIVVLLMALKFGELGSIVPNAKGASYSYVYKALGSEMGFVTGILLYFSYATSISVVALGFGAYLSNILGLQASMTAYFALLLIFVLTIVNILGISKAAKTDFVLVLVKLSILIAFIVFAFWIAFVKGPFSASNFSIMPSTSGIGPIFAASVVILFAYSGFQSISTFTSKIKGGGLGAAKAILAAVSISMVVYVIVVFSLMLLAPSSSYKIAADPMSFALNASHAPGYLFIIVDIGALIATASAALAMILSASRIAFQISEDKLLPVLFRSFNKRRDVATNAVLISALIGAVMLFAGNIYIIAAIANFGLIFSYIMSSFSLIHFRRLHMKGAFVSPFYPYVSVASIVALMLLMYGMPQESLLIGIVSILALIVAYYALREMKEKKVVRIKLFK